MRSPSEGSPYVYVCLLYIYIYILCLYKYRYQYMVVTMARMSWFLVTFMRHTSGPGFGCLSYSFWSRMIVVPFSGQELPIPSFHTFGLSVCRAASFPKWLKTWLLYGPEFVVVLFPPVDYWLSRLGRVRHSMVRTRSCDRSTVSIDFTKYAECGS